jgi:hypothetical protein
MKRFRNVLAIAAAGFLRAFAATAGQPSMTVNPDYIYFPAQEVGTASYEDYVTIENAPGGSQLGYSVVASGSHVADFQLSCDGGGTACLSGQINPGQSVTVHVTFVPSWAGDRQATITVNGNDSQNPSETVDLYGIAFESLFLDGFEIGDPGLWSSCVGY